MRGAVINHSAVTFAFVKTFVETFVNTFVNTFVGVIHRLGKPRRYWVFFGSAIAKGEKKLVNGEKKLVNGEKKLVNGEKKLGESTGWLLPLSGHPSPSDLPKPDKGETI